MAGRRDLRAGDEGDGLDRVRVSGVYKVGPNQRITDILEVEDELLRSEGVDPTWVPFTEVERAKARASLAGQSGVTNTLLPGAAGANT